MSQTRSSLIRAREADRWPCRDHRPDRAVGPALGRVRREGGRYAQPQQPAGQGGYRHPVPCRVQDDHRTGVDETVDRVGLEYTIVAVTCVFW